MRKRLRSLAFVGSLARARATRRAGRLSLAALGVAAGAAVLAAVLATSLAAEDRTLARTVEQTTSSDSAVRVVWAGDPLLQGGEFGPLDRRVRGQIEPVLGRQPVVAAIFRDGRVGNALVDLGAIDGLRGWVRLRSGRWPRPCRPNRCEVLEVAGAGALPQPQPGLRLVKVGDGTLRSELPLGQQLGIKSASALISSAVKYHTAALTPFLLADGVRGLAYAHPLDATERTYVWSVPIRPGDVHPWSYAGFLGRLDDASTTLQSGPENFVASAPTDELKAAVDSSRVAGRRLLLLGGSVAALLLAFLVLAAASMRRDADATRRQLTWRGARRGQPALLSAAEAAAVALAGAVAGWAVGVGLATLAAHRVGSPAGAILRHSVLSAGGIGLGFALAAAAAVVLVCALWAPVLQVGGGALTLADIAGLGALVTILVALSRGSLDAGALASGHGTGVFLLLLPALISIVVAAACARILAPLLRLLEHAGRRGPVAPRLAALSLARNPGRAMIAVVFLVVGLGLAVFAAGYRSTLLRGQGDEAAFEAPADAIVSEDLSKVVPVLEAAPLAGYRRLGEATPAVRVFGQFPDIAGSPIDFTLLGLPADAVERVKGWRGDFSSESPRELGSRLAPGRSTAMRGLALPARGSVLGMRASLRGDALRVTATIETARGDFVRIPLGRVVQGRPRVLRGTVPARARGGRLVAFTFDIANASYYGVANGGLDEQPYAQGVVSLGPPSLDGRRLPLDYAAWRGVYGIHPSPRGSGDRISYLVTSQFDARLRARQPTDGRPVPVIASRRLARVAGRRELLSLDLSGTSLLVRVVGVASHFPSAAGDFVVADRETLATALNAASPGLGVTNEVWLDARGGSSAAALERALRQPPFADLELLSHDRVARELRSDPLARASLLALGGAAVVALLIALVGLVLALVADLRDERAELFDLEAQGAGPGMLRRHVRLRMLMLTAYGLVGGLAAGAVLSALVIDLIAVAGNASAPEPPLVLSPDWPLIAAAGAAYVVVALASIALVTRRGLARLRTTARYSGIA